VTATFVRHRHHAPERHRTRPVSPPPPAALPPPPVALHIDHQGAGHGTVTVLGGARCSGDCTLAITRGRVLTLTAHAPAGARFDGWTAPVDCLVTTTCDVQVRAVLTVAARFSAVAPPPQRFTLTLRATGPGAVGLCHGARTCARTYPAGTRLALTARPFAHGAFRRWHGCGAHRVTCRIAMTRDRTLTARFRHRDPPHGKQTWHAPDPSEPPALTSGPTDTLDVRTTPGGSVQVGAGRCQGVAPCRHEFAHGTLVTLVAEPDAGAAFVRWAACPEVTGDTCRIALAGDRAVLAIFSSPAASALDPPA
jgi:hypothetical protein